MRNYDLTNRQPSLIRYSVFFSLNGKAALEKIDILIIEGE